VTKEQLEIEEAQMRIRTGKERLAALRKSRKATRAANVNKFYHQMGQDIDFLRKKGQKPWTHN
jgi:hypothetical protein